MVKKSNLPISSYSSTAKQIALRSEDLIYLSVVKITVILAISINLSLPLFFGGIIETLQRVLVKIEREYLCKHILNALHLSETVLLLIIIIDYYYYSIYFGR